MKRFIHSYPMKKRRTLYPIFFTPCPRRGRPAAAADTETDWARAICQTYDNHLAMGKKGEVEKHERSMVAILAQDLR